MRRTSDWTDVADHPSIDPYQNKMLKRQCFFALFIFGVLLKSIILYRMGQLKMNEMVFRSGEAIMFDNVGKSLEMRVDLTHHNHSGNSCVMEPAMEA